MRYSLCEVFSLWQWLLVISYCWDESACPHTFRERGAGNCRQSCSHKGEAQEEEEPGALGSTLQLTPELPLLTRPRLPAAVSCGFFSVAPRDPLTSHKPCLPRLLYIPEHRPAEAVKPDYLELSFRCILSSNKQHWRRCDHGRQINKTNLAVICRNSKE